MINSEPVLNKDELDTQRVSSPLANDIGRSELDSYQDDEFDEGTQPIANSDDDEEEEEEVDTVTLPKTPPVDGEMDITPMIDIVFLLLIFFIVSSKMTAEPSYPLPAAKNGAAIPVKSCVILTVKRGGGDNAIIMNSDEKVFSEDLEQQAAEIAEYIQLGFGMQKSEVLIRAEGGVRNGEINRIKEMVSESLEEGQMINFAVLQEDD